MLSLEPIAQHSAYHAFADRLAFIGIPNVFDVVSSLPFLLVGALGVRYCLHDELGALQPA